MATDIVIPPVGESITEGVISAWLKNDGDYVQLDEEIVEIETDKVTQALPATVAGVLKQGVAEGETVEVGATIGSIDESAEAPAESKTAEKKPEPVAAAAGSAEKSSAAGSAPPKKAEPTPAPAAASGGGGAARSTPLAQRLADEHGVSLSQIAGTGPGGRIREHDVLAYIQTHQNGSAAPAPSAPSGGMSRNVRRERMSPLRQRIASRLVEAQQTAAMLTTFNECDMTNVMALRSRMKEAFLETHGVKLGFMSFFMKAACSALQKFPNVNAYIVEGEKGPEMEHHDYCDIAVAVGTDKGLVVPVVRNAESLSFAGIESGILDLAKKARDGKLTLEDMQGGTFTISNGGVYGSMMSTPILNPPQSGILGMHNIIKRPIEHPDRPGEVAIRPMMYLALSYDHRIVDGAGAVGFLKHIKECIEDPERLMLEV